MSSMLRTLRRAYARRQRDWMEQMKRTAASKKPAKRRLPINPSSPMQRAVKKSQSVGTSEAGG